MPSPHRAAPPRLLAVCAALTLALVTGPPAPGAGDEPAPLRLEGVNPAGLRIYATDSWGSFDFTLTNLTDIDRQARVVVFFQGHADVQYGRDVWVPARSTVRTWMLVGPAAAGPLSSSREVEVILYDRTGGADRIIRPRGDEIVRSRGEIYRKREPFTAVLTDDTLPEEVLFGQLPPPDSPAEEAMRLARVFRAARVLSEMVHRIRARDLPTTDQAYDGVDHLVIASGEVAGNAAGMRAVRRWLEDGGKLWVMLDRVDPDAVAPLLGAALDFQLVDRVPLTDFRIEAPGADAGSGEEQHHDQPVTLARVLLPPGEQGRSVVNGWPAWFTRQVGRGKVVFTTLGPRAWYRARTPRDRPSPFEHFADLPVPGEALAVAAEELSPSAGADPFRPEALRPLLDPEIGYSVVGRGWVVLVFGGSLAAALAVGLALRKSRRPELIGWLGPAAALGAAGVFFALGEASRRATPPTVAVVQVVHPAPGRDEASVRGLLAVYHPGSGPAEAGASDGGFFELDMAGLEGKSRRFMLTDLDAWHWDDLALPAGVRLAPFHYTARTGEPITAAAHFGPEGLEGRLASGPFGEAGDGLLAVPGGRNLALSLNPDGTFRAGAADVLPAGQFLAGAVLTDRQQRRQEFYRRTVKSSVGSRAEGPSTLMAWGRPIDMHFNLAPGARQAGDALLVIPLELERSAPGERVTIPGPLVVCRRLIDGRLSRLAFEGNPAAPMKLRFQLPAVVLPFQVEKVRLLARINAPGRQVTVAGIADGAAKVLHEEESPLDPVRVETDDAKFLGLDPDGGLRLDLTIGDAPEGGEKWTIEYLELEVTGRCE